MISIIVPVYKVERYLRQCLDSILNQTYRDLEILLIDDGSPDKCGEICEEYAKKDSRIRVFHHTENRGLSAARNLGLQEAKGEYIGFVDSDDWIEPDMYEVLLRRLEETETCISSCSIYKEFLNIKYVYDKPCDAVFFGIESIRAQVCILTNTVWNRLYRKDCWAGVLFPENHVYEDVATLFKVILKSNSLSCVPEAMYHYRMRKKSIIHTYTMKNLKDYWSAYYGKYLQLNRLPECKKDREIVDKMKKEVAFAAIRIWDWTYSIPKKQRSLFFLRKVSCFIRNRIPFFGKKNWGVFFCFRIFFPGYINDFSFATAFVMNLLFTRLKGMTNRLYP